jgi:hypothetical protein
MSTLPRIESMMQGFKSRGSFFLEEVLASSSEYWISREAPIIVFQAKESVGNLEDGLCWGLLPVSTTLKSLRQLRSGVPGEDVRTFVLVSFSFKSWAVYLNYL